MILLEREGAWHDLDQALREAMAGSGRIVLVSGEAGIGKTALVEHFTETQNVRVVWGACDALFTPRPLGPLHDIAGQIDGQLAILMRAETNRSAIFSTCLNEFRYPTIAVFEDIHWADEATLDLLAYLGRRIQRTATLLIATYRDDELGLQHPLRLLLGDLATMSTIQRIMLAPLSLEAVRHLVGDRPMEADLLHHQTGGNPFYVTEVLVAAQDGVPATVRDAVLARAARLSLSGRAVLNAAAIIGTRIEPWLLAEVTRAEAGAVNECLDLGMLLAQGKILVFRHELAQQTILEAIPPYQRAFLHQAVLDALRTAPSGKSDLARLAHHAEAAGERDAVLAYAPDAARQSVAVGAHRAAAALYALALRYAEVLPPEEHATLLAEYAIECDALDRRADAIAAKREEVELWRRTDNLLKYGESLGRLALLLHLVGQNAEAQEVNNTAIEVLEALSPTVELALIYNAQALLYLANLENRRGVDLAEKALALALRIENESLLPRLYETLGLCWLHLDHVRGIQYLEQSLNLALKLEQTMRVANSYANLSSVYVEFYQLEQAERCFSIGLSYAAERDLEFARMYMLAWRAHLHLLLGRWEEAAADAGEVLEHPETSIGSRGPALMVVGCLRARRGEPGAARALDESLDLLFKLGYRQREGMVRAARAEAAWLASDRKRTLAEACAVYDVAVIQQHPWVTGELAYWRWLAGDTVDTPEWMASPYALQIAGDWHGAAAAWEALGCPYEQARVLADGDTEAGLVALAIFEELGARPMAEVVRQKLREAGVHTIPRGPRATTRENPFGLTNRQLEILALLTENLTNAEIAGRLHISPKTVDHHVSAVLAKLDVSSRDEAADLARQHSDL